MPLIQFITKFISSAQNVVIWQGNYIGQAIMKSKSHPFTIGCLEFHFALVIP